MHKAVLDHIKGANNLLQSKANKIRLLLHQNTELEMAVGGISEFLISGFCYNNTLNTYTNVLEGNHFFFIPCTLASYHRAIAHSLKCKQDNLVCYLKS